MRGVYVLVQNGKAPGYDGITYELFKPVASAISPLLANLFTAILRTVYNPDILKRGVIINLHKGGSKPKDNPDSYRAITLTSIVLKLFESVLLQRCSTNMMTDLNIQQCGFQEGLGCLMTSFTLRESVYFTREHGSKLYVCYLDGRQAFDKVWHDGLFYKLQTKIDDTSLLAFMEL